MISGKDKNRYDFKIIKEASLKDGKLVIILNGPEGVSEIRINEPSKKDIKKFTAEKPIIVITRGLFEVVGLAELQIGYTRRIDGVKGIKIEPVD